MDLTPFIHELILINESVILRGFGGFETSYMNASFDKNNKKFIPPGKKINFRPDWIVDNGTLETHISEVLGIPREEASDNIDLFVKELYQKLNEAGYLHLKGIGKFIGEEGKIKSFHQIEDENFLADSFGLDTLEIESIPEKIQKPPVEHIIPTIPKRRKNTKWYVFSGLMLLLVVISIILFISYEEGVGILNFGQKNIGTTNDTSEIIVFGTKNDILQDSVIKTISQELDQNTQPKNALQPDETTLEKESIQQSENLKLGTFYIVAGSFKSRKNAETMKMQLVNKGFKAEITASENEFFHVIIGQFNNKIDAVDELRRIRGQINQSIWLMEK